MPINPTTNSGIFLSNFAGANVKGINAAQLASALGLGLFNYAYSPTGIIVNTLDTGSFGAGNGVGYAVLSPASLIPAFTSSFAGVQISGVTVPQLITALSNAVSTIISTSVVRSSHSTVGIGVGTGSLIPSTALPYFSAALTGMGIAGITNVKIVAAFSNGLDAALPTSLVTVGITGPLSPASSTGFGLGKIT